MVHVQPWRREHQSYTRINCQRNWSLTVQTFTIQTNSLLLRKCSTLVYGKYSILENNLECQILQKNYFRNVSQTVSQLNIKGKRMGWYSIGDLFRSKCSSHKGKQCRKWKSDHNNNIHHNNDNNIITIIIINKNSTNNYGTYSSLAFCTERQLITSTKLFSYCYPPPTPLPPTPQ